MSDIIDPLKLHTWGAKKPLTQKQDSIKALQLDNKRYYPNDKDGNIDEWGALIKHQGEMYKQQVEQDKVNK